MGDLQSEQFSEKAIEFSTPPDRSQDLQGIYQKLPCIDEKVVALLVEQLADHCYVQNRVVCRRLLYCFGTRAMFHGKLLFWTMHAPF